MVLIPCDDNCIYQQDGYCMLETASLITDSADGGCVHKIERCKNQDKKNISGSKPQTLL